MVQVVSITTVAIYILEVSKVGICSRVNCKMKLKSINKTNILKILVHILL